MAQVSLGSLYLRGNDEAGVAKDVAQGAEWYRRAVQQGDLGTTPETNDAADPDASSVPEYRGMRDDVKRVSGVAAELLGQVYENGGFLPRDYGEAVRWYRRGAEQGYENAQWRLGLSYENGRGVPQDNVQAEKWFMIAAALQDGNSICRGARDQLEKKMSPAEVSGAKRQAQEWLDVFKTRKR
jgi:TPR repeat protein